MNYISEIKRFYDRQLSDHLSAGQIALWHALMEICNRNGWQEWFSAPVETLRFMSGLSRSSVHDCARKLAELKYIEKSGRKYKICVENRTNPAPHLINNKTKLNETKLNQRKAADENGKAQLHGQAYDSLPGGIKL